MSSCRVPVELVETILENLSHDLPSLKSCSLVSRTWLPSLRRILFCTKTFNPETDYTAFVSVLETSPGIAHCIRNLKLIAPERSSSPWGRGPVPNMKLYTDIARLCLILPAVQSLQLVHFSFQIIESKCLAELLQSFKMIMNTATKLSLDTVSFARADEIRRFLHAFPFLADLSLIHSSDAYYTSTPPTSPYDVLDSSNPCPKPILRKLRMIGCSGNVIHPTLEACTLDLRHLAYSTAIGYGIEALHEAIEVCEGIEHLEISSTGRCPSVNQALAQFPATLSRLNTFVAEVNSWHGGLRASPEWLYQAISNLSPTTRVVRIRVVGDVPDCDTIDWNLVDEIIESKRLRELERLIVEIHGRNGELVKEIDKR